MAGMARPAERAPRRGRTLLPAGLPRRRELLAACAVAVLVVHLLLAQLTLVLVVAFIAVGPGDQVAVVVAAGAGRRRAGLDAGDRAGRRAGRLHGRADQGAAAARRGWPARWHRRRRPRAGHPGGVLAGIGGWLPRQFPLALPLAAAEAAVLGWLAWLRADEWAVPPPRPGMVAALRAVAATRRIENGAVLTREGCALGTMASTGATAELRWAEAAAGVLVAGAAERPAALACLQLLHAAVRRRKPVIVLDDGQSGVALQALAAVCQATGTPLGRITQGGQAQRPARRQDGQAQRGQARDGQAASASQLWGRGRDGAAPAGDQPAGGAPPVSLRQVVTERSVALLAAAGPDRAAAACTELRSLAAELRRIGVDGDALVWVPHAELVPAQALGALLLDGATAGLAVLAATTSAATATELAPVAGTVLIRRVTDPGLAAALAARVGPAVGGWPAAGAATSAGAGPAVERGAAVERGPAVGAPPGAAVPDHVPVPVVSAQALLGLGEAEFVLAVSTPRRRLVAPGRLLPARLPRAAG